MAVPTSLWGFNYTGSQLPGWAAGDASQKVPGRHEYEVKMPLRSISVYEPSAAGVDCPGNLGLCSVHCYSLNPKLCLTGEDCLNSQLGNRKQARKRSFGVRAPGFAI